MSKRVRGILLTLGMLLLTVVFVLGFWLLASLDISGEGVTEISAAQSALKAVGLPEEAASPALALNTQGWMGEGEIMTVFESAQPLMALIAQTPGWRVESVSLADYAAFADQWFQGVPLVSPPPGTTFEAWFYASDAPVGSAQAYSDASLPELFRRAGVAFTSDWQAAFFDADTGMFFYYRWIS